MSFDREVLAAAVTTGPVARVVITAAKGSVPRGPGTAMLVTADGQSGTIGGGALEWEAARIARAALAQGQDRLDRQPLGPSLGQCCGGAVTLLTEIWDTARLAKFDGESVIARPLPGNDVDIPLSVTRRLADARGKGLAPEAGETAGWMIEPVETPKRPLWIWGAGHVGRAMVEVLAPLPNIAISWIDTAPERFPDDLPKRITRLVAANPATLVPRAPDNGHHLILTYSHGIDLDLCHALLSHGFESCGLIGSKTKWARFRARLQTLGHSLSDIDRITCPIGDPALGKHPQAIAIGVATAILRGGERGITMDKSA